MSVTATLVTNPGYAPFNGAYDANGHLWVVTGTNSGIAVKDLNGTQEIDISSATVNGIAMGNGSLYIADDRGGIDTVNLTSGTVTFTPLGADFHQTPERLVATTNAVWFLPADNFSENPDNTVTNSVGRWVPGSSSAQFFNLDPSGNDASASSITVKGADSVWIGLDGIDDGTVAVRPTIWMPSRSAAASLAIA